jgi:hypothetical protein
MGFGRMSSGRLSAIPGAMPGKRRPGLSGRTARKELDMTEKTNDTDFDFADCVKDWDNVGWDGVDGSWNDPWNEEK